jgi:uncharacterized membrane protein YagU involved in acid resistance
MAGDLVTRGAVAGAVAGLVFILANMIYATTQDQPAVAPFLAISTVFHFSDMPVMNPNEVVVGLVTHFGFAVLFGIGFALAVPVLRNPGQLAGAALVYGLLLYVVNFQVLGRIVFDFFQNPKGPNQVFELIVHPLAFGLPLVPFFLGWTGGLGRRGAPTTEAPAVGRGDPAASR